MNKELAHDLIKIALNVGGKVGAAKAMRLTMDAAMLENIVLTELRESDTALYVLTLAIAQVTSAERVAAQASIAEAMQDQVETHPEYAGLLESQLSEALRGFDELHALLRKDELPEGTGSDPFASANAPSTETRQ